VGFFVNMGNETSGPIQGEIFDHLNDFQLSKETSAPWN